MRLVACPNPPIPQKNSAAATAAAKEKIFQFPRRHFSIRKFLGERETCGALSRQPDDITDLSQNLISWILH